MRMTVFAAAALAASLSIADEIAAGPGGGVRWSAEGTSVCNLMPMMADRAWKFAGRESKNSPKQPFALDMVLGDRRVACALVAKKTGPKTAEATWTFTSPVDFDFGEVALEDGFSVGMLAGGSWEIGEKKGTFPESYADVTIASAVGDHLTIVPKAGRRLLIRFPEPLHVLLQDNRRWNAPTINVRIGRAMQKLKANVPMAFTMVFEAEDEIEYVDDFPVKIAAGEDWIPLSVPSLEIVPGSVLDLSGQGFAKGEIGEKDRIVVTKDGHFAKAGSPTKPLRFYGINLCFSAQFLEHADADKLLDRIVRLGYNTIRIHHYEDELTNPIWRPGFDWDAGKLDKFDYFVAGCVKRGIYLTTDLYVNRPVPGKQIGFGDDRYDANRVKDLVLVHEPTYQDFVKFVRLFFGRVNPYTKRTLAEEPAMAWISFVNEGPVGMGGFDRKRPEWSARWNAWLAKTYRDLDSLDAAIGDLRAGEDPARGTVGFPDNIHDGTRRSRVCQVFLTDVEREFFQRVQKMLREELKCRAHFTDINCGGMRVVPMQNARALFGYIDEHFYIDHPLFSTPHHGPPSTCRNTNPVRDGALGGSESASVRIWGKPFTVSEYNYSAPGRFRGVGGIITGAMASVQDWDVLWRFAYAHQKDWLFKPSRMDYFDNSRDPLNMAADRITTLMFLRGDVKPFDKRIAVDLAEDTLRNPPARIGLAGLAQSVWLAGIGCSVPGSPAPAGSVRISAREAADPKAVAKKLGAPASSPSVSLDQKSGVFTLDAVRIAGGFADSGAMVKCQKSGLAVRMTSGEGATVVVASADNAPLRDSARMFVTHLTDLQNTGAEYDETARRTLKAWGDLPYLVRAGRAQVSLKSSRAAKLKVWALETDGTRAEEIPVRRADGAIAFEVSVKGPKGARMLYEIAEK